MRGSPDGGWVAWIFSVDSDSAVGPRRGGNPMNEHQPKRESLMEASGTGLLPGLGLALGIALVAIGVLLVGEWWTVFVALGAVVIVAAVVTFVILAVIDSDDRTLR